MNKVYEYLVNELKFKNKDSIVVGVSGGPDSMALLDLLIKVKQVYDINIIVCQINHNTGRIGQKEEQEFVNEYCLERNIIPKLLTITSYQDDNFHNQARIIRYKFFNDIIKEYNAKYLFTAHHSDDLMESILMRLVRGSTLKGYSGFSKEVDMKEYKIIRPLITVTKDEILKYNEDNKVTYYVDSSNDKDTYTRNRFRKYVLPFLKQEDNNVHNKFYKFSKTLLEYNNYIEKEVDKIIDNIYIDQKINIENFKKIDKIIQDKIVNRILEAFYQDDLMLISDNHVSSLIDLINSSKANIEINLPNNVIGIKSYNDFYLQYKNDNKEDYFLVMDNYIKLPNGKIIEQVNESNETSNYICYLDSSEIKLPLYVRNKKNGDKMNILGLEGSKKIKDILIDSKIPLKIRNELPIVVDSNDQIVWLPGLKKSQFDKTKDKKYDIILRYY